MTEVISVILQPLVEKLASLAIEEIQLAWLIKDEQEKLKEKLKMIQGVLADAEQRQTKDEAVKIWLLKLKFFCNDITYVLEEFEDRVNRERRQARSTEHSTLKRKVHNLSSWMPNFIFQLKMAYKIKELKKRLDGINEERFQFNLSSGLDNNLWSETYSLNVGGRKEEHSVVPSRLVGRNKEKEDIIEFLIRSDNGGADKIKVVSIIGTGGIGKTTLAKMVYRDERVINHFFKGNKVWISMPVEFEVKKMIGDIIESLDHEKKYNKLETLQERLTRLVENKRFLFVMDNVHEVKRSDWEELKDLLQGVSEGSRVIVTSQNQSIPTIMGDNDPVTLEKLSPMESLRLLVKWAFDEGQEKNHLNLMKIGEQIVNNCKGNPLAVKTLGSLLYLKKDNQRDWEGVRDSEIWKQCDIITPLKISYDLMPWYLKRCFAYCSILPKSQVFSNLDLIQLWISNGLIQSCRNYQEVEDQEEIGQQEKIGQQYLEELMLRSFFDVVHKDDPVLFIRMHDLIHDLAISVAQTESSNIGVPEPISAMTRHILFPNRSRVPKNELCRRLSKLSRVHSIMFEEGSAVECFLEMRISRFKRLRVLWLDGLSFDLPRSIGSLKYLRFLTLRNNCRIKKLPKSIYKLRNLQYLGLGGCIELEELPTNIKNMMSLRVLSITTKQQRFPERGIGCLTSLQWLFIGECENLEALFDDIQSLTSLRKLFIWACPKLASLPQGIKNLKALQDLGIWSCKSLRMAEGESNEAHSMLRLQSFRFEKLPNVVSLPSWLEGSASTLQMIRIAYCPKLSVWPQWLQDCSLKEGKLQIFDCGGESSCE